ncbi:hypothetical protein [Pedobacter montanisoli]|uniref:Lipoprotein n=1 Tax=Pedobacter montanisoli TaxID=2923277 RepID=A0ABS9ZVZ8_9SPHI|nr:hypothetical protein [Pedobacter montanisoli]MCJ0742478.1 hypothetical protein [Pedobacter montanisoli]
MKKLLLIGLAACIMSCKVLGYGEPTFHIGMSETEFKQSNRYASYVYGDDTNTRIYRTFNQYQGAYKFFIFSKDKLVRFEEGSLPDDFKYMRL